MTARLWGAVGGALAGGLALTALVMRGERETGEPSELVALERATVARLGLATPEAAALPSANEQLAVQAGHLALSALAGAAYAAIFDRDSFVLGSGIAFGLGFYGVAHWLLGPLLGVKQPEWRNPPQGIALHALNHVGFGLATAAGAKLAAGRAD